MFNQILVDALHKAGTFFSKHIICLYLIIFILFWIRGTVVLDPDFGWRLAGGQLILENGFPESDPFTYSMPSYPWVDHAWGQSVLFAFLYPIVGKIGLAALYALLALLSLKITNSIVSKEPGKDLSIVYKKSLGFSFGDFSSFLFILSTSLLFVFFGIRAQVVTWVFTAVILKIVLNQSFWKKYKFFLPAIFLIWANLHGGFMSGLSILLLVLLVRSFRVKKIDFVGLIIFVVSLLITLINPYDFGIWREVWSSISDSKLRWTIQEWMPTFTMLNLPMVIMFSMSGVFAWKQRKNLKLEEFVLFLAFLVQGVSSKRHLPLFVIVSLPIVTHTIWAFYKQIKVDKLNLKRLYVAYKYAWIGVIIIVFTQTIFDHAEGFSLVEQNYYPKGAVDYLKNNLPEGEIFSEYGWGGYLIWKLPEKKVFIDGRMPSWRWEAPNGETSSAFDDYNAMFREEGDYKEVFNNYGVTTVVWTKPEEDNALDDFFEKSEDFLQKFGYKRKSLKLVNRLEEEGWSRVYEDNTSVVLKRN